MNHTTFISLLSDLGACSESINWTEEHRFTLQQAWRYCQNPFWMHWFIDEMMYLVHGHLPIYNSFEEEFNKLAIITEKATQIDFIDGEDIYLWKEKITKEI